MLSRVAGGAGGVAGLACTFTIALAVGVLVHAELPPTKRVFGRAAFGLVNAQIQGSIEVEGIEHLSARGLELRGARVKDASGAVVLEADRLEARIAPKRLLSTWLFGSGDIEVQIPWVRGDRVVVQLENDATGALRLAQAFTPKPKPPRPPGPPPKKPPRNVVVDLPYIEIGAAAAYGNLRALGVIDAEARTVHGKVHVGPEGVSVDTERAAILARKPLPLPASGSVEVHVRSPGPIWGYFAGLAGNIELTVAAKVEGDKVDATVDVPSVKGEAISSLVPALQLKNPVTGRIELHGDMAKLQSVVSLRTGTTQIDARGPITTKGQAKAELDLEARGVDLSTLVADAPPTLLGADAHLDATLSGAMTMKASGKTLPGAAAGIEIPGTDFEATWKGGRWTGSAKLHEPGMPIDATFEADGEGISVKASSKIASIEDAPRLQKAARGRLNAKVDASWRKGQIDAVVSADMGGVARDPVRIGSGKLNAHAWGKPSALVVDASLKGSGFEIAGMKWKDGTVLVRGPVLSPEVKVNLSDETRPSVESKAALSLKDKVAAHDVKVKLGRGNESFTFTSERVDVRNGSVDFGGITIDDLGQPVDGVVQIGPAGFDVRLVSSGVDLGKLADVLGVGGNTRETRVNGTAAIDIDVRNAGDRSTGCVKFDVSDGKLGPFGPIGGSIRARFGGAHVEVQSALVAGVTPAKPDESSDRCLGSLSIPDGAIVSMRAGGDIVLSGSPLKPGSWKDSTGTAQVSELAVNFDRLKEVLSLARRVRKDLPVVEGKWKVSGEVTRSDKKTPPAVSLQARTERFAIQVGKGDSAINIREHDLIAGAIMDASGLLRAAACVIRPGERYAATCDGADRLAELGSETHVDWARLLREPGAWKAIISDADMHARLQVPQQSLHQLLAPWLGDSAAALPVQSSKVSLEAELKGKAGAPQLAVQAYLDHPNVAGEIIPALVCLEGTYDGDAGMMRSLLRRGAIDLNRPGMCTPNAAIVPGRQPLQDVGFVMGTFKAPWDELRKARSLEPVQADAQFKIDGLPLSELGDGTTRGELNGSGGIRGLGKDPELEVNLDVQGLRVGSDFAYDRGSLTVKSDSTGLRGGLDLVDASRGQEQGAAGRLEVDMTSNAALRWAGGWSPALSEGQAVHLRIKPSRFRASSLRPFVEPVLSYVEGDITGYIDATISSGGKPSRIDDAFLSLTNGALQIPTIGQEFIDVAANVHTTAPDQLMVDGFRAKAVSGSVAGTAAITLEDLKLKRLTAGLSTNQANKLRVTLEGVPIGDVWGAVSAQVEAKADRNDVRVDLRGVQVQLSEAEQRSLQDLAANPEVRVVPEVTPARRTAGWSWTQPTATAAAEKAEKTKPWYVKVGFADPVKIERQGMRFSVTSLAGGEDLPELVYPDPATGELKLTGSVRLDEGRVDVVGKFFTIEPDRAFVYFKGEASNPELNVTARWDAPDGTRVYADVTGRLKDPHMQLRSDPARPPGELLALILFGGSSDRNTSAPAMTRAEASRTGAGGGAAAAGVGSGVVAAAGINSLLSDVAPVGISTRVDTSQRNNVRPTVIVDLSNNVTAEATVNTGAVPLGQNPDRYLLTLDWRFLRSWSLRTTVGDAGSSILDVLWTHRY